MDLVLIVLWGLLCILKRMVDGLKNGLRPSNKFSITIATTFSRSNRRNKRSCNKKSSGTNHSATEMLWYLSPHSPQPLHCFKKYTAHPKWLAAHPDPDWRSRVVAGSGYHHQATPSANGEEPLLTNHLDLAKEQLGASPSQVFTQPLWAALGEWPPSTASPKF